MTKNERKQFIIIPLVFIGHKLYSETNLYYFKFHWNKHHNKHHSSFLEKEKKSKTKLFSKTSKVKMKLINGRGTCHDIAEILLKITFKILNGYDRFQLGRTDGQTDRGKTVYPPPPLGRGGIINMCTRYWRFHKWEVKNQFVDCKFSDGSM